MAGASFNIPTGNMNPDSGYMVGVKGHEKRVPAPKSFDEFNVAVLDYLDDFITQKIVDEPEYFLGFWIKDDQLVIDLTENFVTPSAAIDAAIEREQVSIYDCAFKRDINL